jgi:hypothetical protein
VTPRATTTISKLTARFVEAARMQGVGIESGDSRVANRWYKSLVAIREEFREHGMGGDVAILCLIENEDAYVRLWAATYALAFSPQRAQTALESLAASQASFLRFTAATTLSEWRRQN